ncbi:MAG: putative dehydrogenase [Candidatus Latescibacterota bacterium]|jgi:predicted dehydrogenase
MYKVGIVGAGFIGRKRAEIAQAHEECEVALVYDTNEATAVALAADYGAEVASSWREVADAQIDIVAVATTHDALAPISTACLNAGKHVLCEKPMGRNPDEARLAVQAAESAGKVLKAGYNHRYHPAIQKIFQVCAAGEIGPLMNIRGRYGHGGRPGYDREWRAIPEKAGGGELLDQGAHLIDLAKWLLGDFAEVSGYVETQFWDMKPLEDNAYGLFRTAAAQVASLHVSWTQWKNLFSFEVFGRDGYAIAEGLGRSYGPEQARIGRRRVEGGAPDEEVFDFVGEDRSWELEWADFLRGVAGKGVPLSSGAEALATLEWIYRLYRASKEKRTIGVEEASTL